MPAPSAIFMGSKPGSVAALEFLLQRGWEIPYVVVCRTISHPWMPEPNLETFARQKGLQVCTQSGLPGAPKVDFVFSYMYRFRVVAATRALARRGALNFHAGPLPEFGGWAFYSVAILEESPTYGCTCHHMVDGFDEGDLLEVRRFPIDASAETAFSLERRTQEEMLLLFRDVCRLAETGAPLPRVPQEPNRMRYLDRESFEALKRIPSGADAATVDRYARAFWSPPYPGATLEAGGARVEIAPACAAGEIARALHADTLARLRCVLSLPEAT